jgi:hypothetical protein
MYVVKIGTLKFLFAGKSNANKPGASYSGHPYQPDREMDCRTLLLEGYITPRILTLLSSLSHRS